MSQQTTATSQHSHACVKFANQWYDIYHLTGNEKLGEPFCFELQILLTNSHDFTSYLLTQACLELRSSDTATRAIAGIITHIEYSTQRSDGTIQLSLSLQPRYSLLKYARGPRIFTHKDIITLCKTILIKHGYIEQQIRLHLLNEYASQAMYLQLPNENDFDFLHRHLGKEGIYYFFDVDDDGNEIICFCDDSRQQQDNTTSFCYSKATNLLIRNPSCDNAYPIHTIAYSEKFIANKYSVTDYNYQTPNLTIKGNAEVDHDRQNPSQTLMQHFGLHSLNQAHANKSAEHIMQANLKDAMHLAIKTNLIALKPGLHINLDADEFDDQLTGSYLISAIQHFLQQPSDTYGSGASKPYYNKLLLHASNIPFRMASLPQVQPPMAMIAFVSNPSNTDYPVLDDQGRYQIKFHFQNCQKALNNYLTHIPRASLHSGNTSLNQQPSGWHTPLRNNTEVLISFINGDPNQPIILDSLANGEDISPVTLDNKSQHIIHTSGGNYFCLDDNVQQYKITLSTINQQNLFCLNSTQDHSLILLACKSGDIKLKAKSAISLKNNGDLCDYIKNNSNIEVTKNYILRSQQSIFKYTKGWHKLEANDTISIYAKRDLYLTSGYRLEFMSHDSLQYNIAGKHCNFHNKSGEITLTTNKDMIFQGTGSGEIIFYCGAAGFKIAADESITIFGKGIEVTALQNLQLIGKINYL